MSSVYFSCKGLIPDYPGQPCGEAQLAVRWLSAYGCRLFLNLNRHNPILNRNRCLPNIDCKPVSVQLQCASMVQQHGPATCPCSLMLYPAKFKKLNEVGQLLKVRHCQAPPRLSRLLCTPHLKASEKAAASSRAAHVQSACSSDPSLKELVLYHMRLSTGLQHDTGAEALTESCTSQKHPEQ